MKKTPQSKIDYFDNSDVRSNLKKKAVRGGIFTIGSQAYSFFIQLGYTIVLARLLTPSDFGMVAMATSIMSLALLFKDVGLSTATIQKDTITHHQVSNLFWINALIGLTLTAILCLSAPAVASFFNEERLTDLILVYALSVFISSLSTQHLALLKRQMLFSKIAIIETLATSTGIGLAIIAALNNWGYWSLIVLPITRSIVALIGVWFACKWLPSLPSKNSDLKDLLLFGGHLTGSSLVNYLARHLDNILIGKFLGQEQLGLYSRAYALLMQPLNQIRAPISSVMMPALSSIQNDDLRYQNAFKKAQNLISLVALAPIPILFVGADWTIIILFGKDWLPAATTFSYLAIAGAVQILLIAPGWLFITQGRGKDFFNTGAICSCISIASFAVGIPWGINGVALAYSLSALLLRAPIFLWSAGRIGPINRLTLFQTIMPYALLLTLLSSTLFIARWLLNIENPLYGMLTLCSIHFTALLLIALCVKSIRQPAIHFLIRFRSRYYKAK